MHQGSVWEFSYGTHVSHCFSCTPEDRKPDLMSLELKLFNQYFSETVHCYSSCHPIQGPCGHSEQSNYKPEKLLRTKDFEDPVMGLCGMVFW